MLVHPTFANPAWQDEPQWSGAGCEHFLTPHRAGDETFDAGILTQPSANRTRGPSSCIVVMDLDIKSPFMSLVLRVYCGSAYVECGAVTTAGSWQRASPITRVTEGREGWGGRRQ